jgi:hypothetical protein
MEDKDLIEVMLEERKLAVDENNEYGKMQMQLFTILFAFLGVAVGFGVSGHTWIWILLQMAIPMFYVGSVSLNQNIMMNGVFLIFNENRINRLAGRKVCFWQDFVGYTKTDANEKMSPRFYAPLILLTSLFGGVYALPVYFLSREQIMSYAFTINLPLNIVLLVSNSAIYLTFSGLIFICVAILVTRMRSGAVRSITSLAATEQQRFDSEGLIIPRT